MSHKYFVDYYIFINWSIDNKPQIFILKMKNYLKKKKFWGEGNGVIKNG